MADPFTIRIFVPDGDPEGIRIIDRMNWTGTGIVFPRSNWPDVRDRAEMNGTGVYILVGYPTDADDLPTVYIGQADGIRNRIESHYNKKDFWHWGVVFVAPSGGLNRAHITWLEYALIKRAHETGRCHLDNGNTPQEPGLAEAEKADTQAFLKEILQILPLVGLRAFEFAKPVAMPQSNTASTSKTTKHQKPDTIIVPARQNGFHQVFLGQQMWYAVRIAGGMLDKIKYIAGYQTQPVSAITHYAPVDRIEPYGDGGKYKVIFAEKPKEIEPIPYADAPKGMMQGPRYTTFEKLLSAKTIKDVVQKQ